MHGSGAVLVDTLLGLSHREGARPGFRQVSTADKDRGDTRRPHGGRPAQVAMGPFPECQAILPSRDILSLESWPALGRLDG